MGRSEAKAGGDMRAMALVARGARVFRGGRMGLCSSGSLDDF